MADILSALVLSQIFTPAQIEMLNKLCNVFHKGRPQKPSLIPMWDIWLVLCALLLAPYEPLENATLQAITYKTFVLIALALGARGGELCALHLGQFVCPAKDWSFFFCYTQIHCLFAKRPREVSL